MGDGITGLIENKPGLTKGVHTIMVGDVHHVRLSAYRHRHNFHVKPPGWNLWGKI